jgi:hypothetical protein
VAFAVAVAGNLGQLRAAEGLQGAAALDRGRVQKQQIIARAGTLRGEDPDQPLDRLGKPGPPFMQRVLAWEHGEEMAKLAAGGPQEAPV